MVITSSIALVADFALNLTISLACDVIKEYCLPEKPSKKIKKQIDKVFNEALKLWSKNEDIREKKKAHLKSYLGNYLESSENTRELSENEEIRLFFEIYNEILFSDKYRSLNEFLKSIKEKEEKKIRTAFQNEVIRNLQEVQQDNQVFKKYLGIDSTFDLSTYLKIIIANRKFSHLNKIYVELTGEEIEIKAKSTGELQREYWFEDDFEEFDDLNDNHLKDSENLSENKIRIDNITNIISDTPDLHIIGKPGSGKSTTIKNVVVKNAMLLLEGFYDLKIPVYIEAKSYHHNNDFLKILERQTHPLWFMDSLKSGRLHIFIDGLDEIDNSLKKHAFMDIKLLMERYPDNHFVLSERKKNHYKSFDIPIFELKDLDNASIDEFIKKRTKNPQKYKQIWSLLNNNPNMKTLANNPQTLKMLVAVVKLEKDAPRNKGDLFNKFIRRLYDLELQKNESRIVTHIEAKFIFLSRLAYRMNKQGNSPLRKKEFLQMISVEFKKGLGEIYRISEELLDNLVLTVAKYDKIHITQNDKLEEKEEGEDENKVISFIHKAYQDFFCGVYLKKQYQIASKLEIDITDDNWYESLLMCSDLISNEQSNVEFVSFIYKGKKATSSLSYQEHLNEQLNESIACKIAYDSKEEKPYIFNLVEGYLFNSIKKWENFYKTRNVDKDLFKLLFSSVASLNSKRIYCYLIMNSWWRNSWLHSEAEELGYLQFHRRRKSPRDKEYFKEGNLKKYYLELEISSSITDNIPDFKILFEVLNNSIKYYENCISISQRLARLRAYLVDSLTDEDALKCLQIHWDFELFFRFLKSGNNIEYISLYNFETNSVESNERVILELLKQHAKIKFIQVILLEEFKRQKFYENKEYSQRYLDSFFKYDLHNPFFNTITIIQHKNVELFTNLLKAYRTKIKSFSLNLIPKNIVCKLKLVKELRPIPYVLSNDSIRKLDIDGKYLEYFRKLKPRCFTIDKNVDIATHDSIEKNNRCENVRLHIKIDKNIDISSLNQEGIVVISNSQENKYITYSNLEIKNKQNSKKLNLFFLCKFSEPIKKGWVRYLRENDYELNIGEVTGLEICGWNYDDKTDLQNFSVDFNLIENNNDLSESGEIINYYYFISTFNDSRDSLHPDIVVNDDCFLSFLARNITKNNNIHRNLLIKFIYDMELEYLFPKYFDNIHYGIIINIGEGYLKYYSFRDQKYRVNHFYDLIKLESFNKNDIVFIDSCNRVKLIQNPSKMVLNKLGMRTGRVIWIKKRNILKIKSRRNLYDFSCKKDQLNLIHGDIVSFIPAKNQINSSKYPVALRLSLHKKSFKINVFKKNNKTK